jgi:hypothetical protein
MVKLLVAIRNNRMVMRPMTNSKMGPEITICREKDEMQGKTVYIRPKVVRLFPGPCACRSYMRRAAPLGKKKKLCKKVIHSNNQNILYHAGSSHLQFCNCVIIFSMSAQSCVSDITIRSE